MKWGVQTGVGVMWCLQHRSPRRLLGALVSLCGVSRESAPITHPTGAAALSGPIHPTRAGSRILGIKRGRGKNNFPSSSTLNLSGGALSPHALDPVLWPFLLPFRYFFLFVSPLVLYSHPGSIYHCAISRSASSPSLAGKPLEHRCIVAARLHSGPRLRHSSSSVLSFYLPLPGRRPRRPCPP